MRILKYTAEGIGTLCLALGGYFVSSGQRVTSLFFLVLGIIFWAIGLGLKVQQDVGLLDDDGLTRLGLSNPSDEPVKQTPDRERKEESIANSELTVAHIAKRLEHRRIEPALSEQALKVLQARPKGSVEIVYLQNDSEAWILAIDFVHLMNRAGWNVLDSPKGLATILDLGAAPFGMTVQAKVINADFGDPILYDALVDAVCTAGFNAAGGKDATLPNGLCRLVVGPKL